MGTDTAAGSHGDAVKNVLILFDGELLEFPLEQITQARERGRALVSTGRAVEHAEGALPESLLTAEQLAERLNVPASHVYSAARSGKWPCIKIGGRYVRFQASAILALLRRPARAGR